MFNFKARTTYICTFSLFVASNFANAKSNNPNLTSSQSIQYVLTDPVTDQALPNTPYVLITPHSKKVDVVKPALTDAFGRTRIVKENKKYDLNKPETPVVLVKAEGSGKQLLLLNLNDLTSDQELADLDNPASSKIPKGSPYLIWNKNNNQAICGHSNAQGFTQAYFVNENTGWENKGYLLRLKKDQPCSQARQAMAQLHDDSNAEAFNRGYAYARENFVLTEQQADGFLYQYVSELIKNKSVDIRSNENERTIKRAIELAKTKQDAAELNSIGYSLGFERQAYKQGLPLLNEALKIKPNDCYYLNSKGYLLMRQGDLKLSRQFLQESDTACQALRAQASDDQKGAEAAYPIAVNYVHLAENYGLSGDAYMANDFLQRAIKEGSTEAVDEIVEVVKNLRDKKIISEENLKLSVLYFEYVQKMNASKNAPSEVKKQSSKSSSKSKKKK